MGPGRIVSSRGKDVQAQAEAQAAALQRRQLAHALDALGDHRRRFAPHQVGLRMGRTDLFGRGRGPAEIDRRRRGMGGDRRRAAAAVVTTVERQALAGPDRLEHLEEFGGAGVAFVMLEKVPQRALFETTGTADHMQGQAVFAEQLQGRGTVRGIGGQFEAGAQGQQELQPTHLLGQHRGDQPGVFETAGGGHHDRIEAGQFGGADDLAQIIQGRGPFAGLQQPALGQATAGQVAAVAIGRQEPVDFERGTRVIGHARCAPCASLGPSATAGSVHRNAAPRGPPAGRGRSPVPGPGHATVAGGWRPGAGCRR